MPRADPWHPEAPASRPDSDSGSGRGLGGRHPSWRWTATRRETTERATKVMTADVCGNGEGIATKGTRAAFFDLDNTLLAGDSDYLWGEHLASLGVVPAALHRRRNREFMKAYEQGTLDVEEFLAFQLAPLSRHEMHDLERWRRDFIETTIAPLVLPKALELLDRHRRRGETLVIATSTNRFVTEPIARLLEVDHLLATEPEVHGGRYTGRVSGAPCSGHGKVAHVRRWAASHAALLREACFYSDSIADLPLLEAIGHPFVVDPDERLRVVAEGRGWPVISLR